MKLLKKMKSFLFKSRGRSILTIAILAILCFIIWKIFGSMGKPAQSYQTAQVTRGTFISSVSESGQVSVTNRLNISTNASGIINHVYVKNGDTVAAGQTIADITLDNAGQQRQEQAYANYLSAKSALANAQSQLYTLQSAMFTAWQNYTNLATNSTYQNSDGTPNIENRTLPQFTTVQDNWLAAEGDYKNAQNNIEQDDINVQTNWLAYQTASPTVTTPTAGVITDLTITPGLQIGGSNTVSQSNTGTTSSTSSQNIATVVTKGKPAISVDLSEVDVVNVKVGDNATVTLDAFPNSTFTGKVTGINTTGEIVSGVTEYPATILLDQANNNILPNMSATASIITGVLNNVLLAPAAAIQTTGAQSTADVVKNGNITVVPVQIGSSSDTQTVILNGLTQGETLAIGYVNQQTGNSSSISPFNRSLFGGGRGNAKFVTGGGRGG